MLVAALLAGQALAYGAPAYDQGYEPRPCECARVERRHDLPNTSKPFASMRSSWPR